MRPHTRTYTRYAHVYTHTRTHTRTNINKKKTNSHRKLICHLLWLPVHAHKHAQKHKHKHKHKHSHRHTQTQTQTFTQTHTNAKYNHKHTHTYTHDHKNILWKSKVMLAYSQQVAYIHAHAHFRSCLTYICMYINEYLRWCWRKHIHESSRTYIHTHTHTYTYTHTHTHTHTRSHSHSPFHLTLVCCARRWKFFYMIRLEPSSNVVTFRPNQKSGWQDLYQEKSWKRAIWVEKFSHVTFFLLLSVTPVSVTLVDPGWNPCSRVDTRWKWLQTSDECRQIWISHNLLDMPRFQKFPESIHGGGQT